jgi:hypothetical protein
MQNVPKALKNDVSTVKSALADRLNQPADGLWKLAVGANAPADGSNAPTVALRKAAD